MGVGREHGQPSQILSLLRERLQERACMPSSPGFLLSDCALSAEGTDTCPPLKEASGRGTWMDGEGEGGSVLGGT